MKKSLVLFILVLYSSFFYAQDMSSLFNKGNTYYRQKDYQKSVRFYDSILKSGYQSYETYFNLGNAYYRLGKYPLAILNYERAKRLTASDEDIDFNLILANLNIADKIEPLPDIYIFRIWNQLVDSYTAKGWGIISIIVLWISLLLVSVIIFIPEVIIKKIASILFVISFSLFISFSIISLISNNKEDKHPWAIIFTPTVYVKSAPDIESTDIFIIHEGLKVKLIENVGEWYEIRLADGKTGWVKKENFENI